MPKRKFLRKEQNRRSRLKETWRKPKGMHSKVRRKEKQVGKMPSSSMRSPAKKRYLHPKGVSEVLVGNLFELDKVGKKQIVRLRSSLGKRKRIMLLNKAKKMNLSVIGAKDIDQKIKSIEENIKKRKEIAVVKMKKKKKRKKESEKKKETKKTDKKEVKPKTQAPKPQKTQIQTQRQIPKKAKAKPKVITGGKK